MGTLEIWSCAGAFRTGGLEIWLPDPKVAQGPSNLTDLINFVTCQSAGPFRGIRLWKGVTYQLISYHRSVVYCLQVS